MELNQVKAVVTGGASGLGLAVARRLVQGGGRVTLLDIADEKGNAAVAELDAGAGYVRTDVSDEAGVLASIDEAQRLMGGLNVAESCAGKLGSGRVLGKDGPIPLKQFEATVRVNLLGSLNVAKAAALRMQANEAGVDAERGVIVNTASIAAYEGQIGQCPYLASKGG